MSGPLEGVVIVDFTQLVQGPYATQILGDMGAEILKVEPPGGDWLRRFSLKNLYMEGESVSFLAFNRNKRSMTINLKHPDSLAVIQRLVARADVVVENFRPGVMDRLGIGYEALSKINPRIIYAASSGFGQTGPYVKRPGQDLLIQAMTGLPHLNGRKDEPPVAVGMGLADLNASLHIVMGVLAALYEREQSGKGQRVDVNLYSSLLAIVTQEMTSYLNGGGKPERSNSGNNPAPYNGAPYGIYPTADTHIAIGMNALNKLTGLMGIAGYEHLDGNNVLENRDETNRIMADVFKTKTTQEWLDILLAEDIWCAPLYDFEDVENDPQVAENQMIISYDHPKAGAVRTLGIPIKFSETPGEINRPAPLMGEHNAEMLREFGGYTDEEIAEMQARGVL
jgi:crotonobetainyl-CoA:carnitine CoA-transferase CaiB-like acyl-CoA transferase